MPVNVNADTCIGCGACVGVCPVGALSMNADSKSECDEGTVSYTHLDVYKRQIVL